MIDNAPPELLEQLLDPALEIVETTFCIWWLNTVPHWCIGNIVFPSNPDPDGSEDLLGMLDGDPVRYQRWAQEYYDKEVSIGLVQAIYEHQPITSQLMDTFHIRFDLNPLENDAAIIGYPIAM